MSRDLHDGDHIDLHCTLGDLRVSISGPKAQATELLLSITSWREGRASPRSEASFSLVSSVPETPAAPESRAEIAEAFPACPSVHLALASRLSGSSTSGEERIKRAWTAGLWAKAVRQGRIATPNRSKQLDIRPRFYAILQAQNISGPALCKSAGTYWKIIEDLAESHSISHAFPSEVEAQVYFAAAGVKDFEVRP